MSHKELETNIKSWVTYDNKMRDLNEEINKLKEKKTELSNNIIQYATSNNIKNNIIGLTDGHLKFINTKQHQTLTFKFLEECSLLYFNNNDTTEEFIKFVKSKRNTTEVESIKRIFN